MASWDELRRAYTQGVSDGLDDVADAVKTEAAQIIRSEAMDQGDLLSSLEIRRPGPLRRTVAATAEHAVYVHDGTGPGHEPEARGQYWPPFEAIRDWVERNLRIDPDEDGSDAYVFKPRLAEGTRSPREAELDRAARAVQAKIHEEGTEAVRFFTRARMRVRSQMQDMVMSQVRNRVGGVL